VVAEPDPDGGDVDGSAPDEVTFVERGGDSAVLPDLAECALDGVALLAGGGTWHLRRAWAPLTFTDQNPPARQDPVAPARRSATAQAKASYQHDQAGRPYRSFRGLLTHLATLTRNQVRFAGTTATVPMLAEPTSQQREAFQLIGAAIPLALK
jgi:hypothetical protein